MVNCKEWWWWAVNFNAVLHSGIHCSQWVQRWQQLCMHEKHTLISSCRFVTLPAFILSLSENNFVCTKNTHWSLLAGLLFCQPLSSLCLNLVVYDLSIFFCNLGCDTKVLMSGSGPHARWCWWVASRHTGSGPRRWWGGKSWRHYVNEDAATSCAWISFATCTHCQSFLNLLFSW